MKHTLLITTALIITALMLFVGCSSDKETPSSQAREPIDGSTLVWKDGLYYAPDSDKLYSGESVWYYEDGQKKSEITYKNGKQDGLYTAWYENGQQASEVTYKDGKWDGKWTLWYENGQKSGEATYKDGKRIEESFTYWDRDGNKK